MIKKQNTGVKPLLSKVKAECREIDLEVLWGCLNGIRKQIKRTRYVDRRDKLKKIMKDISAIINHKTY